MATCRAAVADALRAIGALTVGDTPSADELALGLAALQAIVLDIHNARGPMADIDISADYVAGENQRVRVQIGASVSVTLPNAVAISPAFAPYDYGFTGAFPTPAPGYSGSADGVTTRAPRDGVRVEVVGSSQALYFYRADTNDWHAATGLALDDETPLNDRYAAALAALVAERLLEAWGVDPSPALARRVARGNGALMMQAGVARDAVMAEYL